ncbi:MAG: CxxC-x17-CxxC domain-containing protein [Candidatus Microgenomates bacterium]|jgi:CxxC-x17-CxxC domain-containing protein
MGNFNRDDRSAGGYRGGFSRGGGRGGFRGGRSSFGGNREMFSAICSNCGKECQVPFKPTNGKPVYCSDCFEKINGGRSDSRRPERSEFRPQAPSFDQSKAQIEAINVKLDKILNLLQPKIIETVAQAPSVIEEKVIKEVKVPKVKKVTKKAASTKEK